MQCETFMHSNPMGGKSFFPNNKILKLELMLYSSFLHEPTFYNREDKNEIFVEDNILNEYLIFPEDNNKSRQVIFYETSCEALDFDFQKTLQLAVKARHEHCIRKSPCELLAIAAAHPQRDFFNKKHPMFFRNIVKEVCIIPTDMIEILNSWKSLQGSKKGFPTFLKRAFSDNIKSLSPYHINKYRRAVIDIVRLTHPKGNHFIKEIMTTGKLVMKDEDKTWETLRSEGNSWEKVLSLLDWRLPHMAALRNIRGFALEVRNENLIQKYCSMLEDGVLGGKQFPFRYLTAYQSILNSEKKKMRSDVNKIIYIKGIRNVDKEIITQCLENCIQKSIENHPKLTGNVIILSDNSGSAWRTFSSEYGLQTIADIGNISALITGLSCTGRATIGLFGDKLIEYTVNKNLSFLENYKKIKELCGVKGINVGGQTENGIWLFFKRSMKEPEKYYYDHLFCYSDQQAGHGGLFGSDKEMCKDWKWISNLKSENANYIHVPKLVENYRQTVNEKLNVFTIQTAGYNDSVLPQSMYRSAILSSWTGKEAVYAQKVIELWDKLENVSL